MKPHDSKNIRRHFADMVARKMKLNKNIYVITGDLGYKMWDAIRLDFPERFINVGAAEQAMIGIGVGLALKGKIPLVYSISTFLLYRPFETIRNYLHYEKIPVKLIGSGRNKDYIHDGISHWALEDKKILKIMNNIHSCWPAYEEIDSILNEMLLDNHPWYINLSRT